jgi:phosphoribosylglycinamide formyltransferase-1
VPRLVVLASGNGSTLQAIIDDARLGAQVVAAGTDVPGCAAMRRAERAGVPTFAVALADFADRAAWNAELAETIAKHDPDLVVLAGFMRVLTPRFVDHYAGRMLNVHPSLLPSFAGLKTHQQALDAGVRLHGASVHFVTSQLDHGPIVAQAAVPVVAGDTPATLAERVLATEHIIYPRAVRWFVEGRLALDGLRVTLTPSEPQWLFAGHTAGEGA